MSDLTGFFRIAAADPDRDVLVAPDGAVLTAGELHGLANRIANGYANPMDYQDWYMNPDKAEAYLASFTRV